MILRKLAQIRHYRIPTLLAVFLLACATASAQHQPLPPLPLDEEEPAPEEDVGAEAPPTKDVGAQAPPTKDVGAQAPPTDLQRPSPAPNLQPPTSSSRPCEEALWGDPPEKLTRRIDRVLRSKDLKDARIGVLAVAYPEGRVLYQRNANERLNPASVTKLFTAAVALEHLGPDRRFETEVYQAPGKCGALYLKGGGDPGFFEKDVQALADKVKEAGVTCADALYLDVQLFDDQILPPHYEEKESDAHWRPKIGAAGMSDGALNIRIHPGDYDGAAPRVSVDPDCRCLMVDSRALTVDVPGKQGLNVSIATLDDKVVVQLAGEIAMDRKKGVLVRRAIPHPDAFTGCYFRDALKSRGVSVKATRVEAVAVPAGAQKVASVSSSSVGSDVKRMQRWSKNYVAEQFVKLAGLGSCRPLSFACGLDVMRRALARFHVDASCLRLENGSGLYDANRVSAAQLVRLLIEVANRGAIGTLFREALPVGRKSGTLRDRMKRVKRTVRAKTGTLDYISALAGYIDRPGDGYIAFAILFNDAQTSAYRMRRLQDQIVEHLAQWR